MLEIALDVRVTDNTLQVYLLLLEPLLISISRNSNARIRNACLSKFLHYPRV